MRPINTGKITIQRRGEIAELMALSVGKGKFCAEKYLEAWTFHPHGLKGGEGNWRQRQVGERCTDRSWVLLFSQ